MQSRSRTFLTLAPTLLSPVVLAFGCSLLRPLPEPTTTAQRLASIPTSHTVLGDSVEIRWDDHHIPFVVARSDSDAAFALGIVHAHLRLGQMELMRRVSQGRLAEMAGPVGVQIDQALRLIDFGRATDRSLALMPGSTRLWLRRYVAGINAYVVGVPTLPHEWTVFGLRREVWTEADVVTLSRVISADVNWMYWLSLMGARQEPWFDSLWQRLLGLGAASTPSFGATERTPLGFLAQVSKSGSNSWVAGAARTHTGAALIASDPHVGISLPNLWTIVGVSCPSYHTVGFTVAGVPVVLLGRNERIAWGGTNMLSISSTFYDISDSCYDDSLVERRSRIRVRWWFDRTETLRESPLGPVISDVKYLRKLGVPRLALTWRGHEPSDEITAFLRVMGAHDWEQFYEAFGTYAVSGQNFLYADTAGHIGQVSAAELAPAASRASAVFLGDPANPAHRWDELRGTADLPWALDPAAGFLVSTNNVPARVSPPLSLIVNWNDRYRTVAERLAGLDTVRPADMKALQPDVFSHNSLALARALAAQATPGDSSANRMLGALRTWDGRYEAGSEGAAALELCAYHCAARYYAARYGEKAFTYLKGSPAVYTFLAEDLARDSLGGVLPEALMAAAADFARYPVWGELHRFRAQHMLGNVPFIGTRYRFGEQAGAGSTNTVMKTAHSLTNRPHTATYGAAARHVSDMSDLDSNWFALLGGQDGWLNSATFADQLGLWHAGEYVHVPLRLKQVRTSFPHVTVLCRATEP